MIRSDAFSYCYADNSTQLRFPSIKIEFGQRVALIGPSGSGKTSLLHFLAGILVAPSSIEVYGTCLDRLSDSERRKFRARNIGLVFQDFQLLEYLNVSDNILLPSRFGASLGPAGEIPSPASQAQSPGVLKRRVQELASAFNIQHKIRNRVTDLSHGERQRVSLCRALLFKPPLILADEPTGSLDPATTELTIEHLLEHSGPQRATLIVATHDYDRLGRFDQVIELGNTEPRNPVKAEAPPCEA